MSDTDSQTDPLVEALRRKVNYQAEKLSDLEEQILELEATVEMLRNDSAEPEVPNANAETEVAETEEIEV